MSLFYDTKVEPPTRENYPILAVLPELEFRKKSAVFCGMGLKIR
jgi:hypothetical protein